VLKIIKPLHSIPFSFCFFIYTYSSFFHPFSTPHIKYGRVPSSARLDCGRGRMLPFWRGGGRQNIVKLSYYHFTKNNYHLIFYSTIEISFGFFYSTIEQTEGVRVDKHRYDNERPGAGQAAPRAKGGRPRSAQRQSGHAHSGQVWVYISTEGLAARDGRNRLRTRARIQSS